MTVRCPICREVYDLPFEAADRPATCPRCRSVAVPEAVPERHPHGEVFTPVRTGGEMQAVVSFCLGLLAITTSICGIGGVFGLLGLLIGFGGLRSRFRTLGIVALMLNLAGTIFAAGMIAVLVVTEANANRELPPHPNGTKAPFADR